MVITNPVSIEQADGPKKVKAVFSKSMPAASTVPHKKVLPVLKFHFPSKSSSVTLQDEHPGNPFTGSGGWSNESF